MNKISFTMRIIVLAVALVFVNLIQYNVVLADENEILVTIPTFDISINDEKVDSYLLEYPLIVYNDITYFPLTWSWCNELGLISGYTQENGLYIANYSSYNNPETEHMYRNKSYRKGDSYKAILPSYPIVINGREIDNSNEVYPLLNLNNITYFPLTWDFVDEFDWDMLWHKDSGFKLSSKWRIAEYSPGERYSTDYFFIVEDYRDYSIIQKTTDLWKMSSEANEYGDYIHINNGGYETFYKLDYSTSAINKINSEDTIDTPYNSGAISSVIIDGQFTGEGTMLSYEDKDLLDLSEVVNKNETISDLYTNLYSVNNIKIYKIEVFFDVDGKEIPPPYTLRRTYVFIDNGNKLLEQVDWPIDQFFSNVYPYGKTGVYLCSNAKYFTCSKYINSCGLVKLIKNDMYSETLNNRYADWNSVKALGMDDAGNLYLKNTFFSENNFAFQYGGTVSPINDGFFTLDLEGKLKKIYPFIDAKTVTIAPTGDVYFVTNWNKTIIHLQTGKTIKLD